MKRALYMGLLLIFLLLVSAVYFNSILSISTGSSAKTDSGILYYVPITLTNSQTIPTPVSFQQMLTVDSSQFSQYEAANLQNIEFFFSNGTVIPSWLESGASVTSTDSVYWLNIASGIPAVSSITVYMGFASPSTNLFNNVTTGEAPQLSPTYGEFDNGAAVFSSFYDNFAGKVLSSKWTTGIGGSGTVSVDNGVTIASPSNDGDFSYISSHFPDSFSSPIILEAQISAQRPTSDFQTLALFAGTPSTTGYNPVAYGYNFQLTIDTSAGDGPGWIIRQTTDSGEENPVSLPSSVVGVLTGIWANSTSQFELFNYTQVYSFAGTQTPRPTDIGFAASSLGGSAYNATAFWIRVRTYPPNNVMPTTSISKVVRSFSGSIYSSTFQSTSTSSGSVIPVTVTTSSTSSKVVTSFPSETVSQVIIPTNGSSTSAGGSSMFSSILSLPSIETIIGIFVSALAGIAAVRQHERKTHFAIRVLDEASQSSGKVEAQLENLGKIAYFVRSEVSDAHGNMVYSTSHPITKLDKDKPEKIFLRLENSQSVESLRGVAYYHKVDKTESKEFRARIDII